MIEAGEIYFISEGDGKATGCEIWSGRPGVVISSKAAIACSGTVNIVYLTSSVRPKAFSVKIPEGAFTDAVKEYPSHVALCGQIHAVDKSRLGNYLGRIGGETLAGIRAAVQAANFDGRPAESPMGRPRKQKTKTKEESRHGTKVEP